MTGSRRRWLIVGPGIVLAAILATQIAMKQRRAAPQPPIIERQVIGGDTASTDPVMEIGFILDRADEFRLSAKQVGSLRRLKLECESKSTRIKSALDRETEAFTQFMSENGNGVSVAEIQRRGAPVSQLSREVLAVRRIYWERALTILNAKQRASVKQDARRKWLAIHGGNPAPKRNGSGS